MTNPPDTRKAPPPDHSAALSTAHQVEELADRLSACADSIHERVMRDIHRYGGSEVPEPVKAAARDLLNAELELRQHADALYADAAACVVSGLGQSQQHLLQLTQEAAVKIAHIVRIGDGITLVARLVGLATAVATGQAAAVFAALDLLKTQLAVIAVDDAATPLPPSPPPPAVPG